MSAAEYFNFAPPVPSVSITNMVNVRAAVISRYEQALQIIAEAEEMARNANLGDVRLLFEDGTRGTRSHLTSNDAREILEQSIDRFAWGYLMRESGLRTFMDSEARKKWDEAIDKGKVPPLTAENVEATFASMYASRGAMFERGVIECFKRLSWHYKTNQPFRFGKKIIIAYLFSVYGTRDRYLSLNHDRCNYLDDLVRVFSVVDGKPEPDHRHGIYSLISSACTKNQAGSVEHEYFRIQWYLKGTGHVTFKRPDLVERLNDIISKYYPGALPDGRRGER